MKPTPPPAHGTSQAGRPRIWLLAAALLLLVPALPGRSAHAQDASGTLPDLQLQRFRPAPGSGDYLNSYGTGVAPHLGGNLGLYFDYAVGPLRAETTGDPGNMPVAGQMTASAVGALGLFDRLELGFLVPGTLYQTAQSLGPVVEGSSTSATLEPNALNDPRISAKVQILNMLTKPIGLAVIGDVYLPVGSEGRFAADPGVAAEGRVALDTWLWRGARMGVNLGYRYRQTPTQIRANTIGDQVLWSVAFNVPLFISTVDALAEFDGAIGVAEDRGSATGLKAGEVPAEFKLGGRVSLSKAISMTFGFGTRLGSGVGAPNFRGFVGIGGWWVSGGHMSFDYDGDGISGSSDRCPDGAEDVDGFEDGDGCPDTDNDGDGIADTVDECPHSSLGSEVDDTGCLTDDFDGDGIANSDDECFEDPEDWDDYQDEDGCPDTDDDGDGIADLADGCPRQPENMNGFNDEDGCPDDPDRSVMVVDKKIVLNQKIHFQEGSARIRSDSHRILNELSRLMKERPEFLLVRIEGHTDSQGSQAFNRKLSQDRAEAVRDYLIDRGVSPKRLAPSGFGESKPIASNDTEGGRAKNRRVEFIILKSDTNQ